MEISSLLFSDSITLPLSMSLSVEFSVRQKNLVTDFMIMRGLCKVLE